MNAITINSFGLSIDGLSITYTQGNQITTLSFDPFATCNLFLELNAIEGFNDEK